MNKNTLEKMHSMKLYGMHHAFKMIAEHPTDTQMSVDQVIGQLVDAEFDDRHNRKITRMLKAAKLRYKAAMEDIIYQAERKLDKDFLIRLAEGFFIDKKENLFITGSTGVGKSYIACALGHQLCCNEISVMYFATSRLLSHLKLCKADGSYIRMMRRLQRQKVLILDDFGLQTIDSAKSNILLELIEDRYNIGSVIVTSQVPVDNWYELIAEKTIADAIMDRLIHRAHSIELGGESMRRKRSKIN